MIVPRDKQMTELEEFRTLATSDSGKGPGKTFDGRQWAHTRGVGDVVVGSIHYAALTEENLLGGAPDPAVFAAPKDPDGKAIAGGTAGTAPGGYTAGYSTSTHEFAHIIHRQGLGSKDKATITSAYTAKRSATVAKDKIAVTHWVDGPRIGPKSPAAWVAAGYDDAKFVEHVAGLSRRRPAGLRVLRLPERGGVLRPERQRVPEHEPGRRRHHAAAAQQHPQVGGGQRARRPAHAARQALPAGRRQRARVRRQAEGLRHLHEPARPRSAAAAAAPPPSRPPVTRGFDVYRAGRLALTVRDQPGTLRSTAPPPPGAGPPPPPGTPAPNAHPFLDGEAHDAVSEDQLGRLLASSESFDAYLQALLEAGYDLAAEGSGRSLPGVRAPARRRRVVSGAIWPVGGRFVSLAGGEQGAFEHATATAYEARATAPMLDALSASSTFEALESELERAGLLR